MRTKKVVSLLLVAAMTATLLAGCGSSSSEETTTAAPADDGAVSTEAAGEEEETTAASELDLADEQVLNLKYTDLSLLDVNDVRNSNEFQVLTEVQEGLFRTFTVDGVDSVEYAGCTSYEISDDGLTYTFHLRDGCMWSDGVAVTAQNYVDSWRRLINPDEAFAYAELALGIAGAEEYYDGEGSIDDVAIEYIDDLTFSVTLAEPDSSFISKVGMVCFYPIRQDLIDAAEASGGDWTNDYTLHVFNGPFVISNRVLENSMTLTKNEYYWDKDNVILEQVNLTVVSESSTQAQLMESQQLDVLTLSDLEYVSLWQSYVDNGTFIYRQQDDPSVTYLVVDQHEAAEGGPSGLMRNAKVRLAMSLAFDRDEFNDLFGEGMYTVAYGLVPYGMMVGDTEFRAYAEEPLAQYAQYTNDSEYLQALFQEGLDELGYEGELSDITLTVFTYSPTTQTTNELEWYKQQLESKLGVNVTVEIYPDSSTWVTARNDYQYDFYSMGWNGDFNDPVTFLDLFRTGNGYAKFMGGYSNEEYDELLAEAKTSMDDAERLELYKEAEEIMLEEGGCIPLYYGQSQIYYQSYVGGLSFPMFGAEYEFSRAYILAH